MSVIYAVNCRPLLDADKLNTVLPLLSDARRQKTCRLIQPQKRAQSAAAGLLADHLLQGKTIVYNDLGQPIVPSDPAIHVSLSHTDDWVFCAIAGSPIGLDAQILTPRNRGVVARLFSAMEQDVKTDDDFTRIWTYKEAYYKLCGKVPLSTMSKTDFSRTPRYDEFTECYYRHDRFNESIHVTVCVRQEESLPTDIILLEISDIIKERRQ